jgi:2-C-methyl-D-erythritol 4-phosphate cytidylyltransferase / 2-C-methyl-D-erythritol 2,4-cyclodiphosphate synthase
VVVAAGSGRRFGKAKQFEPLGNQRVLDWAVQSAQRCSDGVVVVLPADAAGEPGSVPGGSSRSESVRRGLAAIPADATIICVHDGARPFARDEVFEAVVHAVQAGADAAVPGVAMTDTVKQVDSALRVVATPDRASLWAVQTPQAFRAAVLRRVHDEAGADATDDAALVEAAGGTVVVVPGDADNVKITHPDDLARARQRVTGSSFLPVPEIRVGQGVDVHRFTDDPDRVLVLGGCTFPGERGLAGHSDADVVAHAVAEALLGAAGLGDLGEHFPDTDERFRGANSITLLRHVVEMVRADGWSIGNVDADVMCEAPKLAPRRTEMRTLLSDVVGAPVTVAGRRAEGLGSVGRREGIACWAVAVITRMKGTP